MASIGETVKFTCESIHSVIWDFHVSLPENEIMYYSLRNFADINNHFLLIHNVTHYHEGQYGCYGTNDLKKTFYAMGELDIKKSMLVIIAIS